MDLSRDGEPESEDASPDYDLEYLEQLRSNAFKRVKKMENKIALKKLKAKSEVAAAEARPNIMAMPVEPPQEPSRPPRPYASDKVFLQG